MLIIPLPWNRSNLSDLRDTNDVFDLIMKDSTQQYYLVIQDNTITWVGQGTAPGKAAYQIKTRSSTMNGSQSIPKDQGNVGFMGKYSGIDDAILKLFPKSGYCVSEMKFMVYNGQALKGTKDHYSLIEPILCLLSDHPSVELQHFFEVLHWGGRQRFDCSGTWKNNMKLFIGGREVLTLEVWFSKLCSIALEGEVGNENLNVPKAGGGCLSNLLGIIGFIFIILIVLRSCGGDHDSEKVLKDSGPHSKETEIILPTATPSETADYLELCKDFDDSDLSASTITGDTAPVLEGEWIATCLAQWGDYSLNAILSPELYDVTGSYGYPGSRSDIGFIDNDFILSASAELVVHDSMVHTVYEQFGEDMEQTIDFMFDVVCEALSETAKEACSDFNMQVSKPTFENRTNGNTTWKVCTYTGSSKSDDMDLAISNFFYMDDTLRASITILCITSDSASNSSELDTFNTWIDVLQSSLEIERNVQ